MPESHGGGGGPVLSARGARDLGWGRTSGTSFHRAGCWELGEFVVLQTLTVAFHPLQLLKLLAGINTSTHHPNESLQLSSQLNLCLVPGLGNVIWQHGEVICVGHQQPEVEAISVGCVLLCCDLKLQLLLIQRPFPFSLCHVKFLFPFGGPGDEDEAALFPLLLRLRLEPFQLCAGLDDPRHCQCHSLLHGLLRGLNSRQLLLHVLLKH
mmetsp:Transcript_140652/g.244933  ORF Transcript_140652/g.244933 Transcript_140652/m.244933 type:complete len:209 (-) Transcript_140652:1292-1918(-)